MVSGSRKKEMWCTKRWTINSVVSGGRKEELNRPHGTLKCPTRQYGGIWRWKERNLVHETLFNVLDNRVITGDGKRVLNAVHEMVRTSIH